MTQGPPDAGHLASLDTAVKARGRHPTRRAGPRPPRPPAPGLRWSPLAYSVVIGLCAASAAVWIFLIGSTIGAFGALIERQSQLALTVAEVSTRCAEGAAAAQEAANSDALLRAEDPGGPAGRRYPRSTK